MSSALDPPSLLGSPSPTPGRWIGRVDPRSRILGAVLFSVLVTVADRFACLAVALAVVSCLAVLSGWNPRHLALRLVPLNLFMLALVCLLPWATSGSPLFALGWAIYTWEGLTLALAIALKANAIVVVLFVLLGTMHLTTVGHALSHLGVPAKLIHLLLFTVRYLDLLHREYVRLRGAMKVRAFRPRMRMHTYRSYAYLVGMLLVRSLDRAERVLAAMKCRGFRGRFYLLDHFAFSRTDAWFATGSVALVAALAMLEWT